MVRHPAKLSNVLGSINCNTFLIYFILKKELINFLSNKLSG